MRSLVFTLFVFGSLALSLGASFADGPEVQISAKDAPALTRQVTRGKQIFALRCAVCHGDTGGGLAEARLAFPADHRRCESCHKSGNPKLQAQMGDRSFESVRGRSVIGNAFSIGVAPPLHGPKALSAFQNAASLQAFIRAAMPRHAPGTLNDEQSYALTAFILKLNHVLPAEKLNRENVATTKLHQSLR